MLCIPTHLKFVEREVKKQVGSSECIPNRVNISERCKTLPDCSDVSLAVTSPCRLQLCTAVRSLGVM